ncbi:hypothetical protein [uncultured Psychrobacter sp.]|uniref:hypothetical protein n=1 Tax=uncultured Psychrobacter sp. TaxID=259303 RepID=UPI002606F5C3|nr:hypothetical protein [uncultured Psychrobacter sp.]
MSSNDTKTNLKAHHGAHNRKQTPKRSLLLSFILFMAQVAVIGLLISLVASTLAHSKPIATNTNNGYYKDLSKTKSGKPNRYLLAFFVPVIGVDSQSLSVPTDTAPQAQLSATRGQTIISKVNTSPTSYDGLTLQNKTAEKRICRAVAFSTESKTRHPISLWYSVALTQKLKGVIHHG